jgi:hypothetical protein
MTQKKTSSLNIQDVILVAEFNVKEYAFSDIIGDSFQMTSRAPQQSNLGTMANGRQYKGKFTEIYPNVCNGDNIISKARVEFNPECKGWHYGWVGSRFTGTVHHVLSVTTYLPNEHSPVEDILDESKMMKKVKTFCSPSFTVASLRRRHSRGSQGGSIKGSDVFEHSVYENYHDIWQNPPESVRSRDPLSIFESSYSSNSMFYQHNRQADRIDDEEDDDEMQPSKTLSIQYSHCIYVTSFVV